MRRIQDASVLTQRKQRIDRSLRLTLILGLISGLWTGLVAQVAAEPGPSTHLAGSTSARARALALDSALLRGWALAETRTDYVRFETRLDAPTSPGPPDARAGEPVLLRIHADFSPDDGGARVTLRAEEVWRAGTARTWSRDLTATYRGHLERALASLQAQWQQFNAANPARQREALDRSRTPRDAEVRPLDPNSLRPRAREHPGSARSRTTSASTQRSSRRIAPLQSPPSTVADSARPVGIWAFDAERLAKQLGCKLTDQGAVLASTDGDVETHRIQCSNRAAIQVRCDRQRCSR